jgi:hypothetical protein
VVQENKKSEEEDQLVSAVLFMKDRHSFVMEMHKNEIFLNSGHPIKFQNFAPVPASNLKQARNSTSKMFTNVNLLVICKYKDK